MAILVLCFGHVSSWVEAWSVCYCFPSVLWVGSCLFGPGLLIIIFKSAWTSRSSGNLKMPRKSIGRYLSSHWLLIALCVTYDLDGLGLGSLCLSCCLGISFSYHWSWHPARQLGFAGLKIPGQIVLRHSWSFSQLFTKPVVSWECLASSFLF